ncbi:MAG: M15 family metallopeptidase, partial [Eubacteriales bacterium]
LADEVTRIFYRLYLAKYPMTSIILIDEFGGSTGDDASMSANNTSAFNYRLVAGTDHLSKHALGRAIDINPMMNPYVQNDHFSPENGAAYVDRSDIQLGMIDENDLCYQLFIEYGWEWGGAWHSSKDYQHFQKD